MLNAKKNVSNAQLARDLGLPYKTAWALALRVREAMLTDPEQRRLFEGIVEMDEVYIGGKPRPSNDKQGKQGGGHKRGRGTDKMPVVGVVERHGRAFAKAVAKTALSAGHMTAFVRRYVDAARAVVMTDEYAGYRGLKAITQHYAINHSVAYVDGNTHTNTIDGFWALIKRAWYGQHHHYSPKWADHYISETTYKYNNRTNDHVFHDLMRHMVGVAV